MDGRWALQVAASVDVRPVSMVSVWTTEGVSWARMLVSTAMTDKISSAFVPEKL